MRIAVLCRGYPHPQALYNYPFVHDRARAYKARGHDVQVLVPYGTTPETWTFEGVTVRRTDMIGACALLDGFAPDVVCIHAMTDSDWPIATHVLPHCPVIGWIHGSEMVNMAPFQFNQTATARAQSVFETRQQFWHRVLQNMPSNLHFVFVSQTGWDMAVASLGCAVPPGRGSVIHNPVDTDFFHAAPKSEADRFRVMVLRPFDNGCRGTDLLASALAQLVRDPLWPQFQITVFGDGPYFTDHTAPFAGYENVTLHQGFLTRPDIRARHADHGVFLIPTRHDTQGLSRDEAMSSGLVPVTHRVTAVTEFVDDTCAALVAPNAGADLGAAILDMARQPDLFQARAHFAPLRVRRQSSLPVIIGQELSLMADMCHAS